MVDVLNSKITWTAERGNTSFGHNGEVYTNLRPYTTGGGFSGYRFDHGEKNDSHLKVYFISDDGTYLSVWERGHGSEFLRFNMPFRDDPGQTLNDRLNSMDAKLDEAVFHARLEAAVQAYKETGEPQEFDWRGHTYTNLHDSGKTIVDYRFQHGQGDELKVFFFAEDGSQVSGWSRAGQATQFHPDRTETDNLYERLVEVDQQLPLSYVQPLTLEDHLEIFEADFDGHYDFQIAGRDMQLMRYGQELNYLLITDYDFVNPAQLGYTVAFSDDGKTFFSTDGTARPSIGHRWSWSPAGDGELGELLYGNGTKDTLYSRLQLIEYDLSTTSELFDYFEFTVTIDQEPDSDGVRFAVAGEGANLFGYDELTRIDALINHNPDGTEIQNLDFSTELYNYYGYGELSDVEGSIRPGNYDFSIETQNALGYNETIVLALAITERQNGYGVSLEIDIDSPTGSADCTANANVSDDLMITSLDVSCSDDDLESEVEDIFDDALLATLAVVQDDSLEAAVSLMDEFDFFDETAAMYAGAFAPVDNDDWFLVS